MEHAGRGARALALAAALAGAAGCVYAPEGRCDADDGCAAGERCQAGVCVASETGGGAGVDPTAFATVLWTSLAGGPGVAFDVDSVGADLAGDVVVAGAVDAEFDFGPDLVATGAFVVKRAGDDGAVLWAASLPGFAHGRFDAAVLPGGGVFFAGAVSDTLVTGTIDAITGDPVPLVSVVNAHASADLVPVAVAVTGAGDLVVAGTGSADFGCGVTEGDAFAAALNPDGSCRWSRGFGTQAISDVEPLDSGDLAVSGLCTPAGSPFDPDGATTCASGVFVAVLSGADGSTSWLATSSGAGSVTAAHDLAASPDGRLTVVGAAKGAVDFGLGAVDFGPAEASFAATWGPSGAPAPLVRPVEAPYADPPDALALSRCAYDAQGRLWLAGRYAGQPTLGGIRFTACRAPGCDAAAFLAALDASGDVGPFLALRARADATAGAWVEDLALFATSGTVASALRFTGASMTFSGGEPSWASASSGLGVLRVAP